MNILCKVCNRSIIENESEYLAILCQKIDKSLYKQYTTINPCFHEVVKNLNYYITTHNKEFDVHFINCGFSLDFDNNFKTHTESVLYCHNVDDITKIKTHLLHQIDYHKLQQKCFCNIN